jgi:hypothetical protein
MYEDAKPEIQRILKLIEEVPESLREKAFEILLQGYVKNVAGSSSTDQQTPLGTTQKPPPPPAPPSADLTWKQDIPDEVLPRFETMANRLKVSSESLADVFDFSMDPFTFAAFHVEGKSNRERALRIALLVAARGYLATGRWSADWSEIKAMCTHQSCYDVNNFSSTLKAAEGEWFKKVNSGTSVQTNAKGQKEAERLLKVYAGGSDATEE